MKHPNQLIKYVLTLTVGAVLLGPLGCGGDTGDGYPFVTIKVANLALDSRYVKVDGDADCRPGPYPVTYHWSAPSLEGCFRIPAQCFVGAPTYRIDLLGIKDDGVVVQNGSGEIKGTTAVLRPPAGPAQTMTLRMTTRMPPSPINGWKINAAWPELEPCP